MTRLTAEELVALARRIQHERDELLGLLRGVLDSVLDRAPDGMTVAYLPEPVLSEIKRHVGA